MPLLTPEQLQEIRQIIEDYHDAFIVNTVGVDAVTQEVLDRLKEKGLIDVKVESIKDAYIFGQLLSLMQSSQIANMNYEQFKQYVLRNPIPLSEAEIHAVKMAQASAGQYCKGLGNKINIVTGDSLIEADAALRAMTEGIIRNATAMNIARRETVQKLKSDLGWATKDWARDWQRIANTEKHNAMQRGVADHYKDEYGPEVLVAKRVMGTACAYCKKHYLGSDDQPIIFKLTELEANGTNVGRKVNDWLPVLGTMHPHCRCELIRIPEGWGFNEEGQIVRNGKFGERYEGTKAYKKALRLKSELQKAFKLQGKVNFKGIPIAIENRKGTVRKWKDGYGGTGETKMLVGYGYIKRTNGIDEDEIDAFVGPDPTAKMVYIIEQQIPESGRYDEQKVMIGFSNKDHAEQVYLEHYDNPDFKLYTTAMDIDQFKRWIDQTNKLKGEMLEKSKPRLVIPLTNRLKKGGPFIGPRGGKWEDAAHTIPWKGELGDIRTGAIKISNESVHKLVDKLLEGTSTNKHGLVMSKLEYKSIEHTIRIASGGEQKIRVYLYQEEGQNPGSWGYNISGKATHSVRGDKQLDRVSVSLHVKGNPKGTHIDDLKRSLRAVLAHEITHVADPRVLTEVRKKIDQRDFEANPPTKLDMDNYKKYLNEPIEVTASLQQVVRDLASEKIIKYLAWSREGAKELKTLSPTKFLDMSDRWEKTGQHYTPENRKRFLKLAARILQGIKDGTIDQGIVKGLDPMVGAATSQAGNRNVVGFGPNYLIADIPKRPDPQSLKDIGYRPDSREMIEVAVEDLKAENALKRDREVYEFQEPVNIVRPIEVPEEWKQYSKEARKNHRDHLIYVINRGLKNTIRPRNLVEVEDWDEDTKEIPLKEVEEK